MLGNDTIDIGTDRQLIVDDFRTAEARLGAGKHTRQEAEVHANRFHERAMQS